MSCESFIYLEFILIYAIWNTDANIFYWTGIGLLWCYLLNNFSFWYWFVFVSIPGVRKQWFIDLLTLLVYVWFFPGGFFFLSLVFTFFFVFYFLFFLLFLFLILMSIPGFHYVLLWWWFLKSARISSYVFFKIGLHVLFFFLFYFRSFFLAPPPGFIEI